MWMPSAHNVHQRTKSLLDTVFYSIIYQTIHLFGFNLNLQHKTSSLQNANTILSKSSTIHMLLTLTSHDYHMQFTWQP